MPPSPLHPALHFEQCETRGSEIITRLSAEKLFEIIDRGELVIFKNAWSTGEMRELRNLILEWAKNTEVWPQGVSASKPGINFHRIDDGSINGLLPHIFHQFGFGDFEAIPERLRSKIAPVAQAMCSKINEIASVELSFSGGETRIKAIRHPRGGGHLVWHRHPYHPQKVELFLNMSQPGIDYQSGGADFRTSAGVIETSDCFEMGDLIAWRYDLAHRTKSIDPEAPLNWDGDDGFWLLSVEMVSSHNRSQIDNESEKESK